MKANFPHQEIEASTISHFEHLGGVKALRAIVGDFVDRVFDDILIGFLFRSVSRKHLAEMEYQFAARHLGAPVRYEGRPLRDAHSPHPIVGGHFLRRLQILKDTLRDHEVPEAVQKHWIEHTESLRPLITRDGDHCDHAMAGPGGQA